MWFRHILIYFLSIKTCHPRRLFVVQYSIQVSGLIVFFQAKLVCSYSAPKNMYNLGEGGPIVNGEGWAPQQRMGMQTDANLPSEVEANAYTRDAVAETVIGAKVFVMQPTFCFPILHKFHVCVCVQGVEHKPVIYTLPKNTTIEPQQKLESIIDVSKLQVSVVCNSAWQV